jgi:hypothetical protein
MLKLMSSLVFYRIQVRSCSPHGPTPKNKVFTFEILFKVSQYTIYRINNKNTIRMSSFYLAPYVVILPWDLPDPLKSKQHNASYYVRTFKICTASNLVEPKPWQ